MSRTIPINKIKLILSLYKQGESKRSTARKLKISRNTVKQYSVKFKRLHDLYPEIIKDENNLIKHLFTGKNPTDKHLEILELFPSILKQLDVRNFNLHRAWENYRSKVTDGYSKTNFYLLFGKWRKSIGINKLPSNKWRVDSFPENDLQTLNKWRYSNDRRKWEKAVVLLDSKKGIDIMSISKKIERTTDKIKEWISAYKQNGLITLHKKPRKACIEKIEHIKTKKSNLIKLIHETPQIHGINRASWCLKTPVVAYQKKYGEPISKTTISYYIKLEGYSFRKAKEVLTSPDPEYREKLEKITGILSRLTEKEKFFSVDEYGPFSVKIKGGRNIVKKGETKTYPQFQKSKGCLICTAALELSTNQVSHFYSLKKNTKEMIRLLETLLEKYPNEDRIFFSWDAASWHASKELYKKIEDVNSRDYRVIHKTPIVELAPLPSSAQFLNVIESVFSGLAKAIIHNSDYQSVDECKSAIDNYFADRNNFYKLHPKRAGKKIWGKELVEPVFNEANNCKDPKWR